MNARAYFVFTTVVGALVLTACSGSTTGVGASSSGTSGSSNTTSNLVAIDANAFCEKLVNTCKYTKTPFDDCKKAYTAVRVSQNCADTLPKAECSELTADRSPTTTECFPPCNALGAQVCNGDGTISICTGTGNITYDCGATCTEILNKTWSGTCGTSYQSQSAEKAKCWCK